MKSHMDFVNELRAPVKAYRRKERERQRKKAALNGSATTIETDDLMKELEAKFDELFGPVSYDE